MAGTQEAIGMIKASWARLRASRPKPPRLLPPLRIVLAMPSARDEVSQSVA